VPSINQTPEATNVTLRQFQEWDIAFSYCLNQDPTQPIDLSNYVPQLTVRTSALAKTFVLQIDPGTTDMVFNPTTCPQVQVQTTIDFDPGKYEWDLRMYNGNTDTGDYSIYLGKGTMIVEAAVSRD
jgi:hypothetical protein